MRTVRRLLPGLSAWEISKERVRSPPVLSDLLSVQKSPGPMIGGAEVEHDGPVPGNFIELSFVPEAGGLAEGFCLGGRRPAA